MRTLLFDIDGTLLTANGAGKASMRLALQEEFGVGDPVVEMQFGGRTDCGLLVDLLHLNDLDSSGEMRRRFRQAYGRHFPRQLTELGGTVFTGVRELLRGLNRSGRCRVAVMTGNFPETATRKLEHFHLRQSVRWIVGGDLDVHRDDLARRAKDETRRRHGPDAAERIVVIGDTVADIRCGRAIGAEVVAVCTGGTDPDELAAAGPDSIWKDFSDWQAVVKSLV